MSAEEYEIEVEKKLRPLMKFIGTLNDQKRRVTVGYVIANLLTRNFDETSAVGLLEQIKNMILNVESVPEEGKGITKYIT